MYISIYAHEILLQSAEWGGAHHLLEVVGFDAQRELAMSVRHTLASVEYTRVSVGHTLASVGYSRVCLRHGDGRTICLR